MKCEKCGQSERWEKLRGFASGKYEVSSIGRIRSWYKTKKSWKILKVSLGKRGYYLIYLRKIGQPLNKKSTLKISSLVAETFMGKRGEGQEVDHKDNDKSHNCIRNLRYGSKSQNMANRRLKVSPRSGYKGVYGSGNRWRTMVGKKHVGYFATAKLAARAYNKAAKQEWGKFAILNTIN